MLAADVPGKQTTPAGYGQTSPVSRTLATLFQKSGCRTKNSQRTLQPVQTSNARSKRLSCPEIHPAERGPLHCQAAPESAAKCKESARPPFPDRPKDSDWEAASALTLNIAILNQPVRQSVSDSRGLRRVAVQIDKPTHFWQRVLRSAASRSRFMASPAQVVSCVSFNTQRVESGCETGNCSRQPTQTHRPAGRTTAVAPRPNRQATAAPHLDLLASAPSELSRKAAAVRRTENQ